MTLLIVGGCLAALIAFVVLVAALRSGASDPGFTIESERARPDDEDRAA